MLPISNYNHLLNAKNTGSAETLTPSKKNDSGSKLKSYQNYAAV